MKRIVRTAVSAVLVVLLPLLLAGVADAASLYTSPILIDPDDYYVRCSLTNIGTVPYVVTMEVLDGDGVRTGGLTNITVPAGRTETSVFGTNTVNICKFTVGYPSRIRAGGCVSAMGSYSCLDSSPAR